LSKEQVKQLDEARLIFGPVVKGPSPPLPKPGIHGPEPTGPGLYRPYIKLIENLNLGPEQQILKRTGPKTDMVHKKLKIWTEPDQDQQNFANLGPDWTRTKKKNRISWTEPDQD